MNDARHFDRLMFMQVEARWIIPLIAKKNEVSRVYDACDRSLMLFPQVMAHPKYQKMTAAEVFVHFKFCIPSLTAFTGRAASASSKYVQQHVSMVTNLVTFANRR
jgi:hypothetical protein